MMWLFAFLSLIASIQMIIFFAYPGLDYLKGKALHTFARISFGNIGFAGTVCGKNIITWDSSKTNLYFQCEGTTQITDVVSSGLITPQVIGSDSYSVVDNAMTNCYQTKE